MSHRGGARGTEENSDGRDITTKRFELMTKEEWKEAEEKLVFPGCRVALNCDGYRLAIVRRRVSKMRDALEVYVNGEFHGKWLLDDCEMRRRFCRRRDSFFFNPKTRAHMKRHQAKIPIRLLREMQENYPVLMNADLKVAGYSNSWPSFRAPKAHLIKNNENISIWQERDGADGQVL